MAVMRSWLAALTTAAVLSVGLATVVATPAAAATTVTEFALGAGRPERIALAPDGTVYITHWYDNAVSRITDAGTPTGPALAVPGGPGGIVVAPGGVVYSAQWGVGGNTIARIAPDGGFDPAWARVSGDPMDLAVDTAGNLYTANYSARTISKVTPGDVPDVTDVWAGVTGRPYQIVAHPVGGVLMTGYDGSVVRIDADRVPTVVRGPTGTYASAVAYAPNGTAYFADRDGAISRISVNGDLTPAWTTVGGMPAGIAVDGDGDLYVSLYTLDTIVKITADGTPVGSPWATVSAGFMPGPLAVTPDGSRLWAASLTRAAIARVAQYSPPGAVGDLQVTGRDRELAVSFHAPPSDGGSAVTGYEVSTDGGTTWVAVAPTEDDGRLNATLTRSSGGTALINGTSYAVTVRAVNAAGPGAVAAPVTGTPVAPRVAATPMAPSVTAPGPPTDVAVVPGDRQATVSWRPPADDGGAPITGYTVVATAEGATGQGVTVRGATVSRLGTVRIALAAAEDPTCTTTGTSCTVTGLTNGVPYRFTVTATNSIGTSAPAAAAAAVVPIAPPAALEPPTGEESTGQATETVEITPPGPTAARPAEGLAYTGFTLVPALLTGLVLVGGGVVALAAGCRRRTAGD